ncbi:MAG TPA: hypothetical protein VHO47_05810 [Candidatus Babeliales bacterium]|nr:hypothetical protein [Candidatus Babeliales bacterium]
MLKIILLPIILLSALSSAMEKTNGTAPAPLTEGATELLPVQFSMRLKKNPQILTELTDIEITESEKNAFSEKIIEANPDTTDFIVSKFPFDAKIIPHTIGAAITAFACHENNFALGVGSRIHLIAGKEVRNLHNHKGSISALKFTQLGKQLISAANDGRICVWDLEKGVPLLSFQNLKPIVSIILNKEETALAGLEHNDTKITLRHQGTQIKTRCLQMPRPQSEIDNIRVIAFGDKDEIISGGFSDGKIAFWYNKKNDPHISTATHTKSVCALTYKDGFLISAGTDASLKKWDPVKAQPLLDAFLPQNEYAISLKPFKHGVFALTNKKNIYFFNTDAGTIAPLEDKSTKNALFIEMNDKQTALAILSKSEITSINLTQLNNTIDMAQRGNLSPIQSSLLALAAHAKNQRTSFDLTGKKIIHAFHQLESPMKEIVGTKAQPFNLEEASYTQMVLRSLYKLSGHSYISLGEDSKIKEEAICLESQQAYTNN